MVTTRKQAQHESVADALLQTTIAQEKNVARNPGSCDSHASYYQEIRKRQKEQASSAGLAMRLWSQLAKFWFRVRISLGPFMLDPWEEFLYFGTLIAVIYFSLRAIGHVPFIHILTQAQERIQGLLPN